MVWTHNIDRARDFVVRGGGESLCAIIFGEDMYSEARNGKEIAGGFLAA